MAALVTGNLDAVRTLQQPISIEASKLTSTFLLDIVEDSLHRSTSEWIFLRELRVGTGFHGNAAQRLDAYALNSLPHTSMRRVCYEVKISRADFLCEMKQPLKRRIRLRYSNEFYFVTPAGLLNTPEVRIECGLVEVGDFSQDERSIARAQPGSLGPFRPEPWNLLSSDRSGSMAGDTRTDVAVCRRHAEKPTEGVSRPAAQAAEPTTVAIRRLKCSELIRPRRYVEEPAKALDRGKRALRPWHFFATDACGGIAKFSQANSRNPDLDRKGFGEGAKDRLVSSKGSYCGTSASGLYRTRGLDWQVAHHAARRSGLRHQAGSIHSPECRAGAK